MLDDFLLCACEKINFTENPFCVNNAIYFSFFGKDNRVMRENVHFLELHSLKKTKKNDILHTTNETFQM